MKNKKIITLLLAAFMAVGFGCTSKDQEDKTDENIPSVETETENTQNEDKDEEKDEATENNAEKDKVDDNDIGLKKAKEIAIKESGTSDALITEYERDYDNDKLSKYEIKVQLDNEEVEIDIDAKTGEVLKTKKEKSKYDLKGFSNYIGLDKAEEIAFKEVKEGFMLDEYELEDHLDDGEDAYYEFEFKDKSRKNKIKINVDAKTGNIVK